VTRNDYRTRPIGTDDNRKLAAEAARLHVVGVFADLGLPRRIVRAKVEAGGFVDVGRREVEDVVATDGV
jgi:hypothetical protein